MAGAHRSIRRRGRARIDLPVRDRVRTTRIVIHACLQRAELGGVAAAGDDDDSVDRPGREGSAQPAVHVRRRPDTGARWSRLWCGERRARVRDVRSQFRGVAPGPYLRTLSRPFLPSTELGAPARAPEARTTNGRITADRSDFVHVYRAVYRAPGRGDDRWPPDRCQSHLSSFHVADGAWRRNGRACRAIAWSRSAPRRAPGIAAWFSGRDTG